MCIYEKDQRGNKRPQTKVNANAKEYESSPRQSDVAGDVSNTFGAQKTPTFRTPLNASELCLLQVLGYRRDLNFV